MGRLGDGSGKVEMCFVVCVTLRGLWGCGHCHLSGFLL